MSENKTKSGDKRVKSGHKAEKSRDNGVKSKDNCVKKGNTINFKENNIVKASCFMNRSDTKLLKVQDIDLNKTKYFVNKFYSDKNKSYKYCIGHDNNEIIPLVIRLPQMTGCYYIFKDGKTINSRCDGNELLKKYG